MRATHTSRPAAPPRRILIIKPSSLGDIVHALPVLAAIRACYPAARVAWLIATPFAPLLENHPEIDELIPFDRKRFGRMWRSWSAWREFWRFVARLRRRRFDLVFDLQGLLRSALLGLFANAPHRIGPEDAREGARWCYTRRVPVSGATHAVDKNIALARAVLPPAAVPALNAPRFDLALTAAEHASAASLLKDAGLNPDNFTAVIPGARWPTKQWPAAHFADFINRAPDEHYALLGSPDERPLCERIMRDTPQNVANLAGTTSLRQLAALLARARRVVCNDSGPMHIAAAVGAPLVAIFGPTNPARTGPYTSNAQIIQQSLDCVPCYRRDCPLSHHACLQTLSAADVATAARLGDSGREPGPPTTPTSL